MNIAGDNDWNLTWTVDDHKNGHNLYVKIKKL